MRPEKLLRDLLAQPFGPYLEETVLSDKCKFVQTRRLLLEDFQLVHNNEPAGFDRTEFDGDSTPLNVAHLAPVPTGSRVLFRGVLSVALLSHLSDNGLRYLNHDLQQRITTSSLNGVKVSRAHTTTDIESIFASKAKQRNENVPENERYNVNVLIQGYMHLSASFMRSDLATDGLLFHSANTAKNKFRIYQIVSMDIETYKLSRTFLFRHHTLWTMRNILKYASVPAHKCTPQWFLDQYLLYHAYPGYCRWQCMNFLEGVGSSDEGSSNYLEQVDCPPDAQTHRPRHLRKVHKNEVWSVFVSHSEWILSLVEKHKDLKGKVNTQSWRIFLLQVSQLRERAMLDEDTEGKWGLRDEQGLNHIGKALVFSSPLLLPVVDSLFTTPKNPKKNKRLEFTKPVTPITYTSATSPSKASLSVSQVKYQLDNIYDSDFTQGTLSPTFHYTGPWLPDSDTVCTPLPNPSLYALIPKEIFVAPALPADLLWHCPVGGGSCSYIINMCAPSEDDLKLIKAVVSQDDIIHLLEKEWKSNDEQVYMLFYEMVNAHWEDHLKELDIKHVQKGDMSTFEWIHPQRHKPWPPPRWKFMRARRQQLLKFKTKPESPEF